mgnify:CR=1 FL=1
MKKQVAELLLDKKFFEIRPDQPFEYASGLKGPIYCDNRLLIGDPNARKQIAQFFVHKIRENWQKGGVVTGMATAGIPHAAWVAE